MTILLSDPRVTAIPTLDRPEPLVRLDASYGPARALVRAGLATRLTRATTELPPGIRLRVVEGHRSAADQRAIVASYAAELRLAHPPVGDAELLRLTSRYVAPLEVAPHVAGAAVDLTLVDVCGDELDLGTPIDATPENAIVLCVDEKSQIQALDRTVPVLPMQPGLIERRSHDYYRHGTSTLFAALDIATGQVTAALKERHRHQEFLAFLKQIERAHRAVVDEAGDPVELHLVMDNYAAHKHKTVREWLEKSPRFKVHFTPTHASWMNLDQDRRGDPQEGQPSNNFKSAPLVEFGKVDFASLSVHYGTVDRRYHGILAWGILLRHGYVAELGHLNVVEDDPHSSVEQSRLNLRIWMINRMFPFGRRSDNRSVGACQFTVRIHEVDS